MSHSTIPGDRSMDYKQIVVYDVPQNHKMLRTKIIGALEDFGLERFQYSVFGGYLSNEQMENLVVVLKSLKLESKADLRIFRIKRGSSGNPSIITISEAQPPHPASKTSNHPHNQEVFIV